MTSYEKNPYLIVFQSDDDDVVVTIDLSKRKPKNVLLSAEVMKFIRAFEGRQDNEVRRKRLARETGITISPGQYRSLVQDMIQRGLIVPTKKARPLSAKKRA